MDRNSTLRIARKINCHQIQYRRTKWWVAHHKITSAKFLSHLLIISAQSWKMPTLQWFQSFITIMAMQLAPSDRFYRMVSTQSTPGRHWPMMAYCIPSTAMRKLFSQLEMSRDKVSKSLKDKENLVSTPNKTRFQLPTTCREASFRPWKWTISEYPWPTKDTRAWTKGKIKKFQWFLLYIGKKHIIYLEITCNHWVPLIKHKT